MKKALIGISMLVLACILCGPAFADTVPHTPLTDKTSCANVTITAGTPPVETWAALITPYGASPVYTGPTVTGAGSIPVFELLVAPEPVPPTYDNPVKYWPTAGNWDFCAAFDTASCSLGPLASFSTDILSYQNLFLCGTDINGPVNLNPPDGQLPVSANGIPDGEFELGLLAAVLNNTYTLPGTVKNADVLTAYKANFNFFKVLVTKALANVPINKPPAAPSDLRPMVPGLAPWLPGALVQILAGYATEGDAQSVGALETLLGLLSQIGIQPPTGGVAGNTTGFGTILGPDGDADGDGYTNRQEYNYFKNNPDSGSTAAATVIKAQLTASITPPATIPKCLVIGGGTFEEGGMLTLTAIAQNTTALTYSWSKDGGVSIGSASQFVIPVLALTDSGKYKCTIGIDNTGGVVESNVVAVTVVPAGTLPIAGGLGLALLAGACALGGVGSIRRRK